MKRAFLVLLMLVPLFMAACETSGGSISEPRDRTESLLEALGEPPVAEAPVEIPPAEPVPVAVDEAPSESVPEAAEPAAPAEEPIPAEAPVEPIPSEVEEEVIATFIAPEEEEIPVIEAAVSEVEDVEIVPVSGAPEEAEPLIYPPYVQDQRPAAFDEPMDPWMVRLMAVLIVVIILFTAASAIRNAYRAPLSRLVSAAISVLLTAISWVLSYIIAGPSALYAIYLLLLTTYFVLRSTGRSRNPR